MALEEYLKGVLAGEWAGRTTYVSDSYNRQVEAFNEQVIPKLLEIVESEEQAFMAVRILLARVKIEFKDLTFRDLDPVGASSGAYDHHLYPTCYDLDEPALSSAEGFEARETLELVNNPEKLKQLVSEELAKNRDKKDA